MGTPDEPMGQELGVVGLSGLGEQHQGAQTGPGPDLVQKAKSLCWIKEYLCSHAPFGEGAELSAFTFHFSFL